jgi:hypothetical protein
MDMNTETTTETNDEAIARIMAQVDPKMRASDEDELTAPQKAAVERAAKRAYHLAMADGASSQDAAAKAKHAAVSAVALLVASGPATAVLAQHGTPSATSPTSTTSRSEVNGLSFARWCAAAAVDENATGAAFTAHHTAWMRGEDPTDWRAEPALLMDARDPATGAHLGPQLVDLPTSPHAEDPMGDVPRWALELAPNGSGKYCHAEPLTLRQARAMRERRVNLGFQDAGVIVLLGQEPAKPAHGWMHRDSEGVVSPAVPPPQGVQLGGGMTMQAVPQGEASKTNLESHGESIAQGVDAIGLARSLRDLEAARAAGFEPKQTVYERGLRVIEAGVEAARASRAEHDAKPLVTVLCDNVIQRVHDEKRADLLVYASDVGMAGDGRVRVRPQSVIADGLTSGVSGSLMVATEMPISSDAVGSMFGRLGYGGRYYLVDKCPPVLRAHNVNAQSDRMLDREDKERRAWQAGPHAKDADKAPKRQSLVFRTRAVTRADGTTPRSIWATVSPGYATFDVDKVAEAIGEALKRTAPEARGGVTYDGTRARFEALFHSNVQPRHYVAGEFFKAGVVVRTDDTGGGAIRGSSVAWQNLCLNLAIIDRQARDLFSIRHVGSVYELARKFQAHFAKALDAIGHFIKAWDYACEEDVLEVARLISDDAVPGNTTDAVRGIFAGLLSGGQRARIKLPGRSKIDEHVDALVACWEADASSARKVHAVSRAAVVNAITRYTHTVLELDAFGEDDVQRQASALLWGTKGVPGAGGSKPRPLEYVTLEHAQAATDAAAEEVVAS